MSFGRMNTLISIAQEVVTKDAEGFATKTDQFIASVFAYKEGRHGSQKWVNRAAFSEATDLFRFRVIPGLTVTTAHVILCGDDRHGTRIPASMTSGPPVESCRAGQRPRFASMPMRASHSGDRR